MYGCHEYHNCISSQLHAVDGNHVFDEGALTMKVAHGLWLLCYLQFYTNSFYTLQ
jgi:hypothetical protein